MNIDSMNVKELAEYLQLPVETLYKYVRAGKLPAEKQGGGWVFNRDEIDTWMLEHQNVAECEPTKRVLVVEDEAPARELMKRWLSSAGYDVIVAADGVEGEACLSKEDNIDLILTDLKMPRMDGAELLRRIHKMKDRPSIVIITAYFDGELMEKVLQLGTFRIIKKPAKKASVLAVVKATVG